MQVQITELEVKNGVSPKTNKAYSKVIIKTNVHGNEWLSAFQDSENRNWRVGDVVDIEVTPREYNGKTYLDYSPVKKENTSNVQGSSYGPATKSVNSDVTRLKQILEEAITIINKI